MPLRYYPYRTLGAHIYGQLSEIGPKQLKDPRFHDYHRGDVIGQSGVERRYDAYLRGIDGIDAVTVHAFGQPTGAGPTDGRPTGSGEAGSVPPAHLPPAHGSTASADVGRFGTTSNEVRVQARMGDAVAVKTAARRSLAMSKHQPPVRS